MLSQFSAITEALAPLGTMLSADGYELELREESAEVIVAEITAGPNACAECLVPKDMMQVYFETALRSSLGTGSPLVKLIYPTDAALLPLSSDIQAAAK